MTSYILNLVLQTIEVVKYYFKKQKTTIEKPFIILALQPGAQQIL